MLSPSEIIERRYGSVSVSKSKILNIVSRDANNQSGKIVTVYNAVIDTGSITPVVLSAIVDGERPEARATLADLNWSSVHVRTYSSWNEVRAAGIEIADTEAQRLVSGALKSLKDLKMIRHQSNETNGVYRFEDPKFGKLTVHTGKPSVKNSGSGIPKDSTFLPWLAESNFVYEKTL